MAHIFEFHKNKNGIRTQCIRNVKMKTFWQALSFWMPFGLRIYTLSFRLDFSLFWSFAQNVSFHLVVTFNNLNCGFNGGHLVKWFHIWLVIKLMVSTDGRKSKQHYLVFILSTDDFYSFKLQISFTKIVFPLFFSKKDIMEFMFHWNKFQNVIFFYQEYQYGIAFLSSKTNWYASECFLFVFWII